MKITEKWITEKEPCEEAIEWWDKKERDPIKILRKLIKEQRYDWANWFIVRVMNYKGYVSYGAYAAEQVIDLFEKQYPKDKRPRQAIEAAKKCIKNPSEENNSAACAANSAADAAYSAADTAYSVARAAVRAAACAADAAYSAARAAACAACAAYSAAYSADSAARAADSAAASAAYSAANSADSAAASAARNKMKLKILRYGMKLLKEDNNGKD